MGCTRCTDDDGIPAGKTEEEEEDDDEVELRMPGSFDFGDHGGGAAHETRVWVLSTVDRSMLSVCSRTCGGRRS